MVFSVWLSRALLTVMLLVSLTGCLPSSQSEMDEEKEPHFLSGNNAIKSLDFRGAIEEFEKALEVNPRNGKAHFQLGWLYEEKEPDPATAIYHYERFLKLRPSSENAEVVRQRITNCKQDLAKTVLPLPITPGMQRQIDQVLDENKRLKEENEKLKGLFASHSQTPVDPPNFTSAQVRAPVPPSQPATATLQNGGSNGSSGMRSPPATTRTHSVQPGETLASIARKYKIRLDALIAANPGLEPRKMRIGQTLNIPSS